MSDDPYLIPGTDTPRNLLGITDRVTLARAEEAVASARIAELQLDLVRLPTRGGGWNLEHLCAVHQHIFQDVYDWAGELRTVAMSKGSDLHPLPNFLYAQGIFGRLAEERHLRGLEREAFVTKVSQYQSELFALHPFRDGNTRSTTTFISLVARHAGWEIAWRDCEPHAMQEALRASYRAPERLAGKELEAIVSSVTSPTSAAASNPEAKLDQARPRRRRSRDPARDAWRSSIDQQSRSPRPDMDRDE